MANTKTVVELDLVGYSKLGRNFQENLGVEVVARFNEQIQGFVDKALAAVGAIRDQVVKATTGDGAILTFDSCAAAYDFAVALHRAAEEHNAVRTQTTAHRWFRVGISTGDLHETGQEISGMVIVDAVRLEAAARPGQILVDRASYAGLPANAKALFGAEEIVAGKYGENFHAHRCIVAPYTEGIAIKAEAEPKPQRRKPRLFVGSSGQDCLNFRMLKKLLEKAAELSVWKGDIFEDVPNRRGKIREETASSDFAVFIFAPRDVAAMTKPTERNNTRVREIFFKIGNFANRLGEDRMFALIPKISDYSRLSYFPASNVASYEGGGRHPKEALQQACEEMICTTIARKGIWNEPPKTSIGTATAPIGPPSLSNLNLKGSGTTEVISPL